MYVLNVNGSFAFSFLEFRHAPSAQAYYMYMAYIHVPW